MYTFARAHQGFMLLSSVQGLALCETDSDGRFQILRFVRKKQYSDESVHASITGLHVRRHTKLFVCFLRGLAPHLWDLTILAGSIGVIVAHHRLCDR
jgi:hypothetical protein